MFRFWQHLDHLAATSPVSEALTAYGSFEELMKLRNEMLRWKMQMFAGYFRINCVPKKWCNLHQPTDNCGNKKIANLCESMWIYVNLCASMWIYWHFALIFCTFEEFNVCHGLSVSRGMNMSGLNKSTLKHKAGRRDTFQTIFGDRPIPACWTKSYRSASSAISKYIEQLSRIQVISSDLKRFKCLLASGHLLVFKNGLRKMRERPGLGDLWWPVVPCGSLLLKSMVMFI